MSVPRYAETYGPEHARVYEIAYGGRGKSWADEAADVTARVRARFPRAASLLDVGCGTGAHLAAFRESFRHVEGLELSAAMRDRAVRRLPGVTVHPGDMRGFDLRRTFDAVTSLYTVIAYLETVEDMRAAIAAMARHLVPGGVLVIEPWWFPEKFIDGYIAGDLVRANGITIARVSHSTLQDRATRMDIRWVVGEATGIREFASLEFLTLFTEEEFRAAFEDAGCTVEYEREWKTGRGLFIGTRR